MSTSRLRARHALIAVVLAVALGVGCNSGQDPGVEPSDTSAGSGTTSNTLGKCPAGGPDATTPRAGCLDDQGNVIVPQ